MGLGHRDGGMHPTPATFDEGFELLLLYLNQKLFCHMDQGIYTTLAVHDTPNFGEEPSHE